MAWSRAISSSTSWWPDLRRRGSEDRSARPDPCDPISAGMIDDDRATVGPGAHGVVGVRWDDRRIARTGHPCLARDRDLELALDHVPDFLVRVEVLVDRGSSRHVVVGER